MALESISKTLSYHLHSESLLEALSQQKSVKLSHFVGSTVSFLLDSLSEKQTLVVITPDYETAQFLDGDLREIGNKKTVLINPTFKKPYDKSQLTDTSALINRSEALEKVQTGEINLIIVSADALFDLFPSPKTFTDASFVIKKGELISLENLSEKLLGLGYERVNFVETAGEFSQRGGILDIFPLSTEFPVRLEFFGDEIDSIREFDLDSQRSVSFQDQVRLVPNVEQLNNDSHAPLFSFLPDTFVPFLIQEEFIHAELTQRFDTA